MNTYAVQCTRDGEGRWSLRCGAWDAGVTGAESLPDAVLALKKEITEMGNRLLADGRVLPGQDSLDIFNQEGSWFFIELDLEQRFIEANSAPVRRNVSMPAWMDLRLRRNNIDASRLFQEAAQERLDRIALEGRGPVKITDFRDLPDVCADGVLDQYFRARLQDMLDSQ